MPVWDVAVVPRRRQFEYWREAICQAFVPLTPTSSTTADGFASRIELRPLGSLNRAILSSRPQHTAHGPAEVARTADAYYFVNLQLEGSCRVRQFGHDSVVRPGQFAVVDTTEPYYFDHDQPWRLVSYRLPHALLRDMLPDRALGVGAAVDTHSGPGRVVKTLMNDLWNLDPTAGGAQAAELWATSFAAATAATLVNGHDQQLVPAAGLRHAIERYVRQNPQDSTLSVPAICARFDISPRYLHKLFSNTDSSFAAMVRSERLRRCAQLLADPDNRETIAEIAARYGFSQPSSFARAFRREFGVTAGFVRDSHIVPSRQ